MHLSLGPIIFIIYLAINVRTIYGDLSAPVLASGNADALQRSKRTLTTICVEIKPSGPKQEPYFMCRGTDFAPPPASSISGSDVKMHYANKVTPAASSHGQLPSSDGNKMQLPNKSNATAFQISQVNDAQLSSYSVQPSRLDWQMQSQRPQQQPEYPVNAPIRDAMAPLSQYSFQSPSHSLQNFPVYNQQSAADRFRSFHGQAVDKESPKTLHPHFIPNSRPYTDNSASTPIDQKISHFSVRTKSPTAPLSPNTPPGMSTTGNRPPTSIEFPSPVSNPHGQSNPFDAQPQQQPIRFQHKRPLAHTEFIPTHIKANNQNLHAFDGTVQSNAGFAPPPQLLRTRPSSNDFVSAPVQHNRMSPTEVSQGVNEHNSYGPFKLSMPDARHMVKNQPNVLESQKPSTQRYRAIDEAVFGEPNWEFSPDEFDRYSPMPRERVVPRTPPVEYADDPVMRTFYASLQEKPQYVAAATPFYEPIVGDSYVMNPIHNQHERLSDDDSHVGVGDSLEQPIVGARHPISRVRPANSNRRANNANFVGAPYEAHLQPSQFEPQLQVQQLVQPKATSADDFMANSRVSPPSGVTQSVVPAYTYTPPMQNPLSSDLAFLPQSSSPNCNQNTSPFQPVFVMLPCYSSSQFHGGSCNDAYSNGVTAANEAVGSALLPPFFGPFSRFGLPFAASLFGPPPLFPLLAMSNQLQGASFAPHDQLQQQFDTFVPPSSRDSAVAATLTAEEERKAVNSTKATKPFVQSTTQLPHTATTEGSSESVEEDQPEFSDDNENSDSADLFQNLEKYNGKSRGYEKTIPPGKVKLEKPIQTTETPSSDAILYTDDIPSTSNMETETKKTYAMLLGAAKQFADIAKSEQTNEAKKVSRMDKRQNVRQLAGNANAKRKIVQQF